MPFFISAFHREIMTAYGALADGAPLEHLNICHAFQAYLLAQSFMRPVSVSAGFLIFQQSPRSLGCREEVGSYE